MPPYFGLETLESGATILITHGSSDPRPAVALAALAQALRQRQPALATAVLECHPQPLHEQMLDIVSQPTFQGIRRINLVPLFLLPGVHVMEDLPAELALAQARIKHLGQDLEFCLQSYLGADRQFQAALVQRLKGLDADAGVLMAHGSRRSGGNQPLEAMAQAAGAHNAYWSGEPSLPDRLTALYSQGYRRIAVVPYFLSAGGITDAISAQITPLQAQFSDAQIWLEPTLDSTATFADLIWAQIAA
jgi:sirohydrochlorin cobaltochelatase